MKNTFYLSLFFCLALISCSDNAVSPKMLEGSYEGIFIMTCTDCTPQSTDVVLDFDNSQFTGSSNSRNLPAIGTGAFSIKENNIQFTNASFWTADFDWSLILDGNYKCTFKEETLQLERKLGKHTYTYQLKKIK